jgi:hypothetical protein
MRIHLFLLLIIIILLPALWSTIVRCLGHLKLFRFLANNLYYSILHLFSLVLFLFLHDLLGSVLIYCMVETFLIILIFYLNKFLYLNNLKSTSCSQCVTVFFFDIQKESHYIYTGVLIFNIHLIILLEVFYLFLYCFSFFFSFVSFSGCFRVKTFYFHSITFPNWHYYRDSSVVSNIFI